MKQNTRYFWLIALILSLGLPVGFVSAQSSDTESASDSTTVGEKVDSAIEATKTGAAKAKDVTVEGSKRAWGAIKEGASEATEWTAEKSKQAWEATKSTAGKVGSKTKELYETAKESVTDDGESASAPVEEVEIPSSD